MFQSTSNSCPSCNTKAAPGASFCAKCGTSMSNSCPSCKTKAVPGASFCAKCGTALASSSGYQHEALETDKVLLSTEQDDVTCSLWDQYVCCACPCVREDRCLCRFSTRRRCVMLCFAPLLVILIVVAACLFAPRGMSIEVYKEYYTKQQAMTYNEATQTFTEDATLFYGGSTIKFDFPNMSVELQTSVPVLVTNHNVMYGVTARGEASIFYPVYTNQKQTVRHTPGADGAWATQAIHGGFLLGHGDSQGHFYVAPTMAETLNSPDEDSFPENKSVELFVISTTVTPFSVTSWDNIISKLESDCGSCKHVAHRADCEGTTAFDIQGIVWVEKPTAVGALMGADSGFYFTKRVDALCKDVYPLAGLAP